MNNEPRADYDTPYSMFRLITDLIDDINIKFTTNLVYEWTELMSCDVETDSCPT